MYDYTLSSYVWNNNNIENDTKLSNTSNNDGTNSIKNSRKLSTNNINKMRQTKIIFVDKTNNGTIKTIKSHKYYPITVTNFQPQIRVSIK